MYRYSKNDRYITKDLRDFYEENGYMVIRNLVNHELLEECKQRFVDYCNGTAVNPVKLVSMKDLRLKSKNAKGEYLVDKIQDFAYDEIFFKYLNYRPLVDVVESIIGPNITVASSMLINKPPGTTTVLSEHPLHQDLHYAPFRPADSSVGAWTAMEQINESNGCLYVIPGSHKYGELYPHEYRKKGENKLLYHEALVSPHRSKVNLCMEKGDTVIFHPLLLHGSGPNFSKGFRKAISCHYADSNSYFIDVRGTNQKEVGSEMVKYAQRHYRSKISFVDMWKIKSRLVRGSPGNFQAFGNKL